MTKEEHKQQLAATLDSILVATQVLFAAKKEVADARREINSAECRYMNAKNTLEKLMARQVELMKEVA